ncbi:TPA: hypothetical protein QCK11_004726 [Enterobacter asburiae]|nr:hypothetical protein [Enterobacter asburiae]
MNLQKLKEKLAPKLHPIEVEGETIYIHRPTSRDFEKCTNAQSTLIICVKDENGDPIFSEEDIEGRINVNSIDFVIQTKIYNDIFELISKSDRTDEVEKK